MLLNSCILSKFYIKPQQRFDIDIPNPVVSYRNSTSNHNTLHRITFLIELYLIEILHQTTTWTLSSLILPSCILSKFYIKPQRVALINFFNYGCILSKFYIKPQHDCNTKAEAAALYLIEILHQTTTRLQHKGRGRCVVSYRNSTSNHNMLDQ